jgi:hypothetical protein
MRLLSFAAALALFAATRTLGRGIARTFFAALSACALLLTLYSAEARPYALIGLLGLAAFLAASTGRETPRRLLAAAAAAAAALYVHYLALFVVASLLILALAARRFRSALALGAGALLFLPWLPVLRGQPAEAIAWMREPAASSLVAFVSALGGVGRAAAPFGGPAPRLLFLAGLAAGLLLLAAAAVGARRDPEIRTALACVVLVLGGALVAGFWRPVAFAGRTEMAVLPIWIWGVARAAEGSRAARWGAGAAALLGTVASLVVAFAHRPPGASDLAAAIAAATQKGDVVVAAGGFYLPLRNEADRGRLEARLVALPEDVAAHPGWFIPALPGEAESLAVEKEAGALAPRRRLFLVVPPAYATEELLSALALSGSRARELARDRDILVMVTTRSPDSPAAPSVP